MCTPLAFSFFPSGLTTVPQESTGMEGQGWREKLTQLPQSVCAGRRMGFREDDECRKCSLDQKLA